MHWFVLVRHAPTAWNIARKLQGRTDIPLTAASQQMLHQQVLSEDFLQAQWLSSPLQRAQQTAQILCGRSVQTTDALIETNWGDYEGESLQNLKQRIADDKLHPKRGLDMQPPGGESALEVKDRLENWLVKSRFSSNIVAVTHKGVLRCALSLATNWNMLKPYPENIDWQKPQLFYLDESNRLRLAKLNLEWHQAVIFP